MAADRERRRFPRLEIPEEARVFDENGRELGTVTAVSGGGMTMKAASLPVAESLDAGRRLRITVTEAGYRATHDAEVVVRDREGGSVGMEFVRLVGDQPL